MGAKHTMTYNPDIHHRRSIRLPGFDYSSAGAYFVTICTHERACVLGEIIDNRMVLSDPGRIVFDEWSTSERIRSEVGLDAFVVMPNQLHGIIWILSDKRANGVRPRNAHDSPTFHLRPVTPTRSDVYTDDGVFAGSVSFEDGVIDGFSFFNNQQGAHDDMGTHAGVPLRRDNFPSNLIEERSMP